MHRHHQKKFLGSELLSVQVAKHPQKSNVLYDSSARHLLLYLLELLAVNQCSQDNYEEVLKDCPSVSVVELSL